MRITITIPEEFRPSWDQDRFENVLRRLYADAHFLAGKEEKAAALMLVDAFKNAEEEWG